MKTAIILHGMPSKEEYLDPTVPSPSNMHWIPWVQRQLILNGVLAQAPELPQPHEPVYEKWLKVFEQFEIDEDTILIGHSLGAGFLIRWLTENDTKVGKIILVAPFLDPDRNEVKSDFFKFKIKDGLSKQTKGITIFYSTDDYKGILDSVDQIMSADKDIQRNEFKDKGHFTFNDMKTDEFPELVNLLFA